ncbi:RES family NAD+ phosphorylase [Propionivibrio soli]|uniref:RES family NAD+ phosphorylase n=1 Tax=Propionivibrio soli TaxID=2976531 RepID=UPI0021E82B0F
MIDTVFADLRLAETHADAYRNIVSIRVSQDVFDDLSDDPEDWSAAIKLELATKSRAFSSPEPVIHRPFEEAHWNDAIDYPFKHWMRSRYSDGSFGVWYGADSVETTVYETVYHWREGFLRDAGFTQPGIRIERKIYLVRCDAALIDLRPTVTACPALVDPDDYTLTHQVGAKLHREGHPGLLSRSARCSGDVYAVFNPRVLSDPRQLCFLTYTTTDAGSVTVERQPGTVWLELPDASESGVTVPAG